MSSVGSGLLNIPKRSYITTDVLSVSPFATAGNSHVYTYSKTYNAGTYTWSGSLTPIDFTASPYSSYNAPGIVLRETGRKLYKDANPGVDRYMVGVFIVDQDGNNVSGDLGQMYIDPNCSVFAAFNGDRPTYIPTNEDDEAGNGLDLGNPVYTRGNITTVEGSVVVSSQAGATGSVLVGPNAAVGAGVDNAIVVGNTTATADNQIITAGGITAASNIITTAGFNAASNITTYTPAPGGTVTVNTTLGNVFKITMPAGNISITASSNGFAGQPLYFIITNTTGVQRSVDFNSPFISAGVTPGIFTVDSGAQRQLTASFICDGTTGIYMLSTLQATGV